jgi:hypothetical protein
MQNCPICNEPTHRSVIRTDHVMKGGGVSARCMGQKNAAEVTIVEMVREHAREAQREVTVDAFEEHQKRSAKHD